VFFNGPEGIPRHTKESRKLVFESQCQAYRTVIGAGNPWLTKHVAAFHGAIKISDVIGVDGRSKADTFLLDCCYGTEILKGEPLAPTTDGLRESNPELSKALSALKALGISAEDGSVFFPFDPVRFKLIDFEMDELRHRTATSRVQHCHKEQSFLPGSKTQPRIRVLRMRDT
jgi:hypothetical protein